MTLFQIQARNRDLEIEAELDDFRKLEAILRFNRFDSWVLDLPYAAGRGFEPASGVIVRRDDLVLFSGPVTSIQRTWGDAGDLLTIAGVSDDAHLEDRLAVPAPPPYNAAEYDVRTGPAESVLKGYVDDNLGPGASAGRILAGLSIELDAGAGAEVTGRARFQKLGDLLRELALAGGDLGFRIVQVDAGELRFEVNEPVDRTATAIFSKGLGNLRGFKLTEEVSEANAGIVGGGGEGVARTFLDFADPAQIVRWNRRIETFRDRRDTVDAAELAQAGVEELASKAEKTGLSISPIDTRRLAFLRDYALGDRVTVDIDGVQIRDVLREVKIVVDENAETVTPTIGTSATRSELLDVFRRLRELGRKVALLERR